MARVEAQNLVVIAREPRPPSAGYSIRFRRTEPLASSAHSNQLRLEALSGISRPSPPSGCPPLVISFLQDLRPAGGRNSLREDTGERDAGAEDDDGHRANDPF